MSATIDDLQQALSGSALAEVAEAPDRVYLFVSFDLVDATAFKAVNPEWPVVISKFYELSLRELQEVSSRFHLWKLVGDEVLMYREVTDFGELADNVKSIHSQLNKVVDQLHNTFDRTRNLLSVKGTVWLARASFIAPQQMQEALSTALSGAVATGGPVNIRIQVPLDSNTNEVDFLGPDIDVGFRIAQFSDKRKLVVSANLANVLMTHSPRTSIDVKNLKIVALERLKGVWNGRPYPIIWYYNDWSKIQMTGARFKRHSIMMRDQMSPQEF